jgi:hypothetical protein
VEYWHRGVRFIEQMCAVLRTEKVKKSARNVNRIFCVVFLMTGCPPLSSSSSSWTVLATLGKIFRPVQQTIPVLNRLSFVYLYFVTEMLAYIALALIGIWSPGEYFFEGQ